MALTPEQLDELAPRLWDAVASGDRFPPFLAGISYDDGLGLQVRMLRRHLQHGAVLAGWKVGLTSARARSQFGGIDVRPFGYLDADHVLRSGATVEIGSVPRAAVETELCFTVAERLFGSDLSAEQVRAGLATVAAGYEINQRQRGSLKPDLAMGAAARMYNWGVVEGTGASPAELHRAGFDLADAVVTMSWSGADAVPTPALRERAGDHVDDHYLSIALLARALADYDLALEPGQKIITGAVGRFPAEPGQTWRSEFSGVGTVEVRFT